MSHLPWDELTAYRARIRGCLLGGAIGDSLGNPIEMKSMVTVEAQYGETGITGLVADREGVVGRITDDTQMTLFTAEGWLRGYARMMSKGISGAETALVREAYLRWLDTQQNTAPLPELSAPTAPGGCARSPGCTRGVRRAARVSSASRRTTSRTRAPRSPVLLAP